MDETQIIDKVNKLKLTIVNSIDTLREELKALITVEINKLDVLRLTNKVTNNYVDLLNKVELVNKELNEKLLTLDNFVKDNLLSLRKETEGKVRGLEARLTLLEAKETVTKEDINTVQSSLFSVIKSNTNSIKELSETSVLFTNSVKDSFSDLNTKINSINKSVSKQEVINNEFKDSIYNNSDRIQTLKGELEQSKFISNNRFTELDKVISYLPNSELIVKINESLEQLRNKIDTGLCNNSKIVNSHKELIEGVLTKLTELQNKPNKELTRQDILKLLTIDGIVSFDSMMKLPFIPLPASIQNTTGLVIAGDIKDKRVKIFVNGSWVIIA